jgi:hypothetical protein
MRVFPRGLASDTPKPLWVFHRQSGARSPDIKWVFPRGFGVGFIDSLYKASQSLSHQLA